MMQRRLRAKRSIDARKLPARLADVERVAIEYALAFTDGNKSYAAELLGIQRHRLYRKLRKHGIASGIGKRKTLPFGR